VRTEDLELGTQVSVDMVRERRWRQLQDNICYMVDCDCALLLLQDILCGEHAAIGRHIADEVCKHRGQLLTVKRGKNHATATGAQYQWGYNAGQPGRCQPGLVANSLRFPKIHRMVEEFAQGSWAILMALNPDHCWTVVREQISSHVACIPHTGLQSVYVSLDYVDPLHLDPWDAGPALISLFGDSSNVENYFTFPDLESAVRFKTEQVIYFLGSKLRHATTNIQRVVDDEKAPTTRVGIGCQTSSRTMNAYQVKGAFWGELSLPDSWLLDKLPMDLILKLAYHSAAHCNGSVTWVNQRSLQDLATSFCGFWGNEIRHLLRWMHIRHRLRNQLDILKLLELHQPLVTVVMRDGSSHSGKLIAENQKTTRLKGERKALSSGDVIWMEWPADEELGWLLNGSTSWSSDILCKRDCIHWPLEQRHFWCWKLSDLKNEAMHSMILYDDLECKSFASTMLETETPWPETGDPWLLVKPELGWSLVGLEDDDALFYNASTGGFLQKGAPEPAENLDNILGHYPPANYEDFRVKLRQPRPSSLAWAYFAKVLAWFRNCACA
jgi:hypothetical protein